MEAKFLDIILTCVGSALAMFACMAGSTGGNRVGWGLAMLYGMYLMLRHGFKSERKESNGNKRKTSGLFF